MILHVATGNPGKLRDFALAAEAMGSTHAVQFATVPGLDGIAAPDEDQDTFRGNAELKARYYSQRAPGLLVLSDDSGLEVDALEGRPGVRSARFADDLGYGDASQPVDPRNNEALLLEMIEQTKRTAHYRCVLAVAKDGSVLFTAAGTLDGSILTEPAGQGGFGYDPLFFVPEAGCTMAQVTAEQRLLLSHRSCALRQLLQQMDSADSASMA